MIATAPKTETACTVENVMRLAADLLERDGQCKFNFRVGERRCLAQAVDEAARTLEGMPVIPDISATPSFDWHPMTKKVAAKFGYREASYLCGINNMANEEEVVARLRMIAGR